MKPPLRDVLEILRLHGHDLREYLSDVLERRLGHYLAARPPRAEAAFLADLERDAAERGRLLHALMVSASGFFRYVELFHVLREQVIARLGRSAPGGLRVWVAGASTGEEAWSIAMVLAEAEARGGPSWEVFASDRDPAPLAIARAGRYPREAAARIPADLRAEYVTADGDGSAIAVALRSRVVFCEHDLLGPSLAPAEAVLARFDLVLCCNVLIYLERHLQARVLDRLLTVLAAEGALALGPHETPPPEVARRLRRYPDLAQPVNLFAPVGPP